MHKEFKMNMKNEKYSSAQRMYNERDIYLGFRGSFAPCFIFVCELTNRAWNSLCLQSQIALYLGVNKRSGSYCNIFWP